MFVIMDGLLPKLVGKSDRARQALFFIYINDATYQKGTLKIMRKQTLVAVTCAAVIGYAGVAQAKCRLSHISFSGDIVEIEGEMTIVSGTRCQSSVSGIRGALSEVKITQQPKVGKAGVEYMRPYYMAKPGYQGPDEFTYTYIGTDQYGGPMRVSVKRKITVVPSL